MTNPIISEYWLTLTPTGSIQGVSSIYPPKDEWLPNQIPITDEEFHFLRQYSPIKARSLLRSIERKMKKGNKK